MAVGVDDMTDPDLFFLSRPDEAVCLLRRIDHERLAALLIAHQVSENRHLSDLSLFDEHDSSRLQGIGEAPPPPYFRVSSPMNGIGLSFFRCWSQSDLRRSGIHMAGTSAEYGVFRPLRDYHYGPNIKKDSSGCFVLLWKNKRSNPDSKQYRFIDEIEQIGYLSISLLKSIREDDEFL